MYRPTKEQLVEWRREAAQWDLRKPVTVGALAFISLLAEVDALTEERDTYDASANGCADDLHRALRERDELRRDIGEMHGQAEAVGAEVQIIAAERDEARAALARLREAGERFRRHYVQEMGPGEFHGDDRIPIEVLRFAEALDAKGAADLADAQRREWMAAALDEVVALMREQHKEERDDKGWSALDIVACDIEERAARLRVLGNAVVPQVPKRSAG